MVWIAEIRSAERKAVLLEGQTPQLIELAELNKLGLPTASNRKRLALKGDFEGWSVSTSETEWTNYLEAYGITAAPYPEGVQNFV